MADMRITLDCGPLIAWAEDLGKARLRSVMASGLNRAARAARKQAVQKVAADVGVSVAKIKPSIGKLIRASPGNLRAAFVTSKSRIGIKNTAGFTYAKGQGILASSHVLTGGGSSHLHATKGFIINLNGNRVVMIRTGKGRKALRPIYAESTLTAMSQENAAARVEWQRDASTNAAREVSAGVQAALLSRSALSDSGSDD